MNFFAYFFFFLFYQRKVAHLTFNVLVSTGNMTLGILREILGPEIRYKVWNYVFDTVVDGDTHVDADRCLTYFLLLVAV